MNFTASQQELLTAIKRIKMDMDESRNAHPYITIAADSETGTGAVYASDKITFIESRFEANVVTSGFCQVDRKFGQILSSIREQDVTIALSETGNRIQITGANGFKGRLQTVALEPIPYAVVKKKLEESVYSFEGYVRKADLTALIQASKVLPQADDGVSPYQCIIIDINGENVIGSSQESAVGAVEELPIALETYTYLSEEPIRIIMETFHCESLIGICGDLVMIKAAPEMKIPIQVADPNNPTWLGMIMQMNLRSK